MGKKVVAALPVELKYLQPFANQLGRKSVEDLKDIDASPLDAALRKRIRGLDEGAATERLSRDRDVLEAWLKGRPEHPAQWILGYLLSPDLATHLVQPPEPEVRGPEMSMDAPPGWTLKKVPFRIDIKAGKLLGSIMAIDELNFEHMLWQREQVSPVVNPVVKGKSDVFDVTFGACRGKKYLHRMTSPAPWKQVDYLLAVPGGFVCIQVGTMTGADFDESPLEHALKTLRLSASA